MKIPIIGLAFCLSLSYAFGQLTLSGQTNTFLNGGYGLNSCSNGINKFRKSITNTVNYNGTNYFVAYNEIGYNSMSGKWELSFLISNFPNPSTIILVGEIQGSISNAPNPPCGVAFGGSLSSSNGNCYQANCSPPDFPMVQQSYTKCNSEVLTITPTCATGIAKWFQCTDALCLGTSTNTCNPIAVGNLTPSIIATTTYKVGCQNECGMINYQTVTVNVLPYINLPSTPQPQNQSICAGSSTTLTASCDNNNTVRWYNGTTLAGTGNTLNTGSLSSSKSYQVKCFDGTCESYQNPNLANVTIIPLPTTPTTADVNTCTGNSHILTATCTTQNSILKWYDAQTGGNYLGQGNYETGIINTTTDFHVACTVGNCVSSRSKLSVIIVPIEAPNSYSPDQNICQFTTVTLAASCNVGTPTWYDNDYYYSPIGIGNSFQYTVDYVFDLYVACETQNCRSELRNISFLIKEQISHQPEEINGNPTGNTILTFDGCQDGEVTWNIHDGNINENYDVFIASKIGNPLNTRLKGVYYIYASCSDAVCGLPERINFNNCFENQHSLFSPDHDYNSSLQIIRPYDASSYIDATNKITGTAKTIFQANVIELKPGFKAVASPNGAVFIAKSGGGCFID